MTSGPDAVAITAALVGATSAPARSAIAAMAVIRIERIFWSSKQADKSIAAFARTSLRKINLRTARGVR
jgi:hypothetical protein